MKTLIVKKGEELEAARILSNRTDDDFDAVDATVKEVIARVRAEGDDALYYYSEKFGGPGKAETGPLRVTEEELEEAYRSVEPEVTAALELAAENIRSFHEKQLQKTWSYTKGDNIMLGQLIVPIQNVGVYVPGGKAVYPSDASGIPFTAAYFQSQEDPITNIYENMAAEQKARKTYDNILALVKESDVREPIKFLRAREIVHFQRFGEALRMVTEDMDKKNFYAFNPSSCIK